MMPVAVSQAMAGVVIDIGGVPVSIRASDSAFAEMLRSRYTGFVTETAQPHFEFTIELMAPSTAEDDDISVRWHDGQWLLQRGDFLATWNPATGKGHVRQTANPYSIDCVLRIVHSLVLAREGGFLLHSASAIRNGRAFLFSGISGAGKTTISRLAPPDVTLLTDEISYVRRDAGEYRACGTPFAGELARVGENCSAPLAALFFLEKAPHNVMQRMSGASVASRLLRNILFFAQDQELVNRVFRTACDFVERVPVYRLSFFPDERVWDQIR
ncbi:MAG TPA: hypothetical protein VFA89_04335 [Terriglobales bacterium]|nr:hypothetical protein [Terriglobales bacterium]